MPENNDEQLHALSSQILRMAQSATEQTDLPSADLRRVLNFLDKLVQVVDQAFRSLYTILVDIEFLRDEEIGGGQIRQIRRDLEMVSTQSWYRDVEKICGRLHQLSDNYKESIAPIVQSLAHSAEWSEIFRLMDEHESHIIRIVQGSVWELKNLLAVLQTTGELAQARELAERQKDALQDSLQDLTDFHNQILGMSGSVGFLELIETDRAAVTAQLQLLIDRSDRRITNISTGGGAYVEGNVSVTDGDFVGNSQTNSSATAEGG